MTPTDPKAPPAPILEDEEPAEFDPDNITVGMFVGYTVTSVGNGAGAWIVDPETGLVTGPVPATA